MSTARPRGIHPVYNDKPLRHIWAYRDSRGQIVGYAVRYEKDGRKEVVPYFRQVGGDWQPGGPPAPRLLYGLPELAMHAESTLVFVVEGEKCAAALHQLGFPAVSSLGGCGSAGKADWTPLTQSGRVVILPDQDGPGQQYARDVATAVR